MNKDFNQKALKKVGFTLGYYLLIVAAIFLARLVGPAGPCTLGLDFVVVLYGGIGSIILWGINVYLTIAKDNTHSYSLAVHSLICASWIILMSQWA